MKFIDEVKITIASGKGGSGCVSFRREKFLPRGGPDGGDGGKGGNVIIKSSHHLNSLIDYYYQRRYIADNGVDGGSQNKTGADGQSVILLVPPGTLVRDVESGELLVDLGSNEERTLLEGGRGGKGNCFFKNSVNQAPQQSQPGEPGDERTVILELKLLADVGIIGYPNVGKSTLISRISAAKPKIADYPFTTLQPNLGVVRHGEDRSFVVADIPGLIPDAHKGAGLGIRFLKHIERTRVFVHLIDVTEAAGRNPLQDYRDINTELLEYDKMNQQKTDFFPLSDRKQLVVFNKVDAIDERGLNILKSQFKKELGYEPLTISAVSGKGIKELIYKIGSIVFTNE